MSRHQARKRFGQHFLTDESVVEAIVRAIAPARDDCMVEIGPGLSALTQPLLRSLARLTVVEIDRDLAARLRGQYPADRLTVVEADALTVDFASLGARLRVVRSEERRVGRECRSRGSPAPPEQAITADER